MVKTKRQTRFATERNFEKVTKGKGQRNARNKGNVDCLARKQRIGNIRARNGDGRRDQLCFCASSFDSIDGSVLFSRVGREGEKRVNGDVRGEWVARGRKVKQTEDCFSFWQQRLGLVQREMGNPCDIDFPGSFSLVTLGQERMYSTYWSEDRTMGLLTHVAWGDKEDVVIQVRRNSLVR